MKLEGVQIIERIGAGELTGVDEAHEDVADAGAVLGLVEERVLAVMETFPLPLYDTGSPSTGELYHCSHALFQLSSE